MSKGKSTKEMTAEEKQAAQQKEAQTPSEPETEANPENLPQTRGEAPPPAEVVGGMEDIDKDDLVIPRLKIIQTTAKEGTPGKFGLNLTMEEFDTVDATLLKVTKGRVMFDKEDLTLPPLCGSQDRIVPADYFTDEADGTVPMSDVCDGCVQAQWDGNTPPPCSETYTMLMLDVNTFIPFFLQLKGTAIRPSKSLITAIFLQSNTPKLKKAGAMSCDFTTHMALQKKSNKQGTFYVPVFSKVKYQPDQPYRDQMAAYSGEEAGFEDKPIEPSEEDLPI